MCCSAIDTCDTYNDNDVLATLLMKQMLVELLFTLGLMLIHLIIDNDNHVCCHVVGILLQHV